MLCKSFIVFRGEDRVAIMFSIFVLIQKKQKTTPTKDRIFIYQGRGNKYFLKKCFFNLVLGKESTITKLINY